ncbi:YkgJ family cysteine cluster protein [Maribacter halichondriae]|uniref:YkgJ family cysteine cluster protein n=1 Tax=Maribacter halichondriae TaxID=2980554 RepID=UPI002359633A|nr:YkgJ family cysteine cluster protein [Maribacter sp. Hal144]
MSIERKVRSVEQLFFGLDQEISKFQNESSLRCKAGCGKCCTHPDVDASPLEFLPWAFHLFLNGAAEKTLAELKIKSTTICHVYRPLSLLENAKGSCDDYMYRGLICRLFGFGANRDKYGALRLATCKVIKESQATAYGNAQEAILKEMQVPIFTDYYMRLSQIDYHLGSIILPINKALKMAIEEVLQYYAYRPFPKGHKNIA